MLLFRTCFAQETPTLHFYSEVTAPYYWFDETGKPQGLNVDIGNAIIKRLTLDASVEHRPWARAFNDALNKPNVVLLSTLRTQKRESQMQWLGLLHKVKASLVTLSDSNKLHLDSLEEAKHYNVGSVRGYGSADYLLSKGFVEDRNLVLLPNTSQLWTMLYNKRIDLAVSSVTTDKYEIRSIGFNPDRLRPVLDLPELTLELQLATGYLTSTEVTLLLRKTIDEMKLSGEFGEILQKWGVAD